MNIFMDRATAMPSPIATTVQESLLRITVKDSSETYNLTSKVPIKEDLKVHTLKDSFTLIS